MNEPPSAPASIAPPPQPPAPAPAPAPEPTKEQSLVPSLTKETWELLELRLWNAFSKKLWVLLTSVLTLATLLGLLGMDAWLKAKVEDGLKQQKDDFEKVRKGYEARADAQLLATGLLFSLQQRLLNDSANYRQKARDLRSKLSEAQLIELKKLDGIAPLLDAEHNHRISKEDFEKQVQSAVSKFPELGSSMQRDSQIAHISELRLWSVHIVGLQAAVRAVGKDVFEGAKTSPSALAEYYEKRIYPEYIAVIKKNARATMWAGSGDGQVNSLQPDPRMELNFFIPSAYDEIFK